MKQIQNCEDCGLEFAELFGGLCEDCGLEFAELFGGLCEDCDSQMFMTFWTGDE